MNNCKKTNLVLSKWLPPLRSVLSILILSLLSGCIPFPHSTTRSPEIRGRVLDAQTKEPIQGAKIFLKYHPTISGKTDASGHFHVKETHNFHLGVLPPEGHWPEPKYYLGVFTISQTNYSPRELSAGAPTDKGDILLEPLINPLTH